MVLVGGVDLSDHVSKVTIEDVRAPVDVTAMGAPRSQASRVEKK